MGYLITLEGPDGSGKTTVMQSVESFFRELGIEIIQSREPGGVPIAEAIREILLSSRFSEMDFRTETLLFAAARRQHFVEKIRPLLSAGKVVVLDRFLDSSIAYQGYARGVGAEAVERVNDFALEGFRPDLTLLLDLDVDIALSRIAGDSGREVNKLDLEKREFHRRVREGYLKLADESKNRRRFRVIDASQSPEKVAVSVYRALESMFSVRRAAEEGNNGERREDNS